ncbi:MAG: hypothetical protein NTX82_03770 [Candidatus Parcubacteria bacterium]|nr:hypothetical protein [Candidatus Parcubacteria bacterium]
MKPDSKQKDLNRQWQNFLAKTNGSLQISLHCLQRIQLRFPDFLEMTEKQFLDLVRKSKPVKLIEFPKTQERGIKVQNHRIMFAVSFKTKKVMSLYPCRPKMAKKSANGRVKKIKEPYHRPTAKNEAKKQIRESQSA